MGRKGKGPREVRSSPCRIGNTNLRMDVMAKKKKKKAAKK
jgi:hypothetical protein